MVKLVAFDWNGTILADTIACLKADDAALICLGYKPIGMKKFQETFEIPLINFYKKIGVDPNIPKDKYEQSEALFHQTYEKVAAKSRTRAGARSLLKWLAKNHVPAVIFSNHVEVQITKHLVRLDIGHYFAALLANGQMYQVLYNRRKGEKLKAYLREHKIKPSEILVVGDTVEEIEIAHELGAISVALTHGYNSTARLKAAKPDYLLGDLRQIEKIIAEGNKVN